MTNEMTWAEIHALYSLSPGSAPPRNTPARYNIAPTTDLDFCRLDSNGHRMLDHGRWWLVPFWAKEIPKMAMFNARIETVDTSGAFKEAFKSKRCLVPADGYFEWTKNEEDGGKDPWHFHMEGGAGFSFAGLWAHNDKLDITSFTIITAPAIPHLAHLHDRMPVILDPTAYDEWLSPEITPAQAKSMLVDHQIDDQLQFFRVARNVNATKYDGTDTKMPLVNSL